MAKDKKSVFEFLNKLRGFLINYEDSQFWIYSNYREFGSLLIKNTGNDQRILFKPWNTKHLIGSNKVQSYLEYNDTFKGHYIDKYLFIGKNFRENAKRYSRIESSVTLIEVDFVDSEVKLFGSMNIDVTLLNTLIEFADNIKYHITYDFQGILRHQGFKEDGEQISRVETRLSNPTAFISYSWDSEDHKLWVLKLASDLIRSGVNVLIDEWDLNKYRNDLQYFMESGIRESDFVIMVCTENYAERANVRVGGVGIENTIITGEFFDANKSQKYLPIVRKYDKDLRQSLPSYLKTKYAIDFRDESNYDRRFEELLRMIFNIPKYRRPKLGKVPDLESKTI